jgi:hypothetical protein
VGLNPQHLTLTANMAATVTLDSNYGRVEILNVDGAAAVYVSNNGVAPTVGGDGFHVLPAVIGALELDDKTNGDTVVKLISAGTPKVSVRGL